MLNGANMRDPERVDVRGCVNVGQDVSIDINVIFEGNVTLANGQVLVLGGFVKTKITETRDKSPILGDIPILGWLFKNKNRSNTKSYLFVFTSPTIVKPRQSPGSNLYTRRCLDGE